MVWNGTRASRLEQIASASLTLLLSAASNYRWREYTNGMEWSRRAFGVVLSAVLLLAMALPALCGKCQATAAKPDCAENHGARTKQPVGSSSGYTDCDHCDESQGISANRQMNPGTLEFLIFLPDSTRTQPHDSNRLSTKLAISAASYVYGAAQNYIFLGKTHPPKSVYSPLITVSLKI
jgi:hypothetical protein